MFILVCSHNHCADQQNSNILSQSLPAHSSLPKMEDSHAALTSLAPQHFNVFVPHTPHAYSFFLNFWFFSCRFSSRFCTKMYDVKTIKELIKKNEFQLRQTRVNQNYVYGSILKKSIETHNTIIIHPNGYTRIWTAVFGRLNMRRPMQCFIRHCYSLLTLHKVADVAFI